MLKLYQFIFNHTKLGWNIFFYLHSIKHENSTLQPTTTKHVVLWLHQTENRQPCLRKYSQCTNQGEIAISESSINTMQKLGSSWFLAWNRKTGQRCSQPPNMQTRGSMLQKVIQPTLSCRFLVQVSGSGFRVKSYLPHTALHEKNKFDVIFHLFSLHCNYISYKETTQYHILSLGL